MFLYNRYPIKTGTEICLAYAICERLAKDIVLAYREWQESPQSSSAEYEHKFLGLVDTIDTEWISFLASESGFSFSRAIKFMEKELDIYEYKKY